MTNKQYIAGRRFEYRVRDSWRKQGFTADRMPGSKSPRDVVVFVPWKGICIVLYIQCQVSKPFNAEKIKNLVELAKKDGAVAMLAWRDSSNKIQVEVK